MLKYTMASGFAEKAKYLMISGQKFEILITVIVAIIFFMSVSK
jgi:hypothetical protein